MLWEECVGASGGITVHDFCDSIQVVFFFFLEEVKLTMNRCFYRKSNISTKHFRGIPGLGISQESHGGLTFKIKPLLSPQVIIMIVTINTHSLVYSSQ